MSREAVERSISVKRPRQAAGKNVAIRVNSRNKPAPTPLDEHKLQALKALCAQVANDQKFEEKKVRRFTSSWFGVNDITELPDFRYRDAVRLLADVRLDMVFFF